MRFLPAFLLLISYASVCAQVFTPGMPGLAHDFNLSMPALQWSMSLFLIFYSLGQLLYGPLANAFGRKRSFYIGIFLAIIGSFFCVVSDFFSSYGLFLLGRSVMALGSGASLTLTLTIIRDLYASKQARKIISLTMSAFAIIPGVAIFIGGYIVEYFDWVGSFYFLLGYGFVIWSILFLIPETKKEGFESLRIGPILRKYKKLFTLQQIVLYGFLIGFCTAFIYIYTTIASVISINIFKLTPAEFGTLSLFPSVGIFLGTSASALLTGYVSARKSALFGIGVALVGLLVLIGSLLLNHFTPLYFFSAVFLMYGGTTMVYSNGVHLATEGIDDKSTAMSTVSFINMVTGTIGSMACGFFEGSLIIAAPILFSVAFIGIVVMFFATRSIVVD